MSTDGTTKPPSFTPTGTTGPQRTSVRTSERVAAPTAVDPDGHPGTNAVVGDGVASPVEPTGPAQAVRGARPSPVVPGGHPDTGAQTLGATARATALRAPVRLDEDTAERRPTARPADRDDRMRTVGTAEREPRPDPSSIAPRRVRLALARVDPWSVMKLAFLLSFAVGIMIVVAAAVVWTTLDSMGIFAEVNKTIAEIAGSETFFDLEEYVAFDRVIALSTIVAIVDVVLLTALATLFAFLYNVVASLVGGVSVTLTDD